MRFDDMVRPDPKFYRVYLLDIDGSIEATELLSAANDAEVFELIRRRGCAQPVEIWDGRRRVVLVEPLVGTMASAAMVGTLAA